MSTKADHIIGTFCSCCFFNVVQVLHFLAFLECAIITIICRTKLKLYTLCACEHPWAPKLTENIFMVHTSLNLFLE